MAKGSTSFLLCTAIIAATGLLASASTPNCILQPSKSSHLRVDLSSLASQTDYSIPSKAAPKQFSYTMNICKQISFTDAVCLPGSTICELFNGKGQGVYGKVTNIQLSHPPPNTQNITAIMSMEGSPCQGSGGNHNAVISFICSAGGFLQPSVTFEDIQTCSVAIDFPTPVACGQAAKPKKNADGGAILVIVFFVVLIVYIILGAVLNHRNGKSGKELMPNSGFWFALPSLIADGFRFTLAKITGKSSSYQKM